MKKFSWIAFFDAAAVALASFFFWLTFYLKGRQFALRDRLHQAGAIVVLAGTRGNIKFLHGKIATAVHLYRKGWAPRIICSGKFSVKVTNTPTLIPRAELQTAVAQGRIHENDVASAATSWDFITYLDKKELFIQRNKLVCAAGEEDLLAFYLQNGILSIIRGEKSDDEVGWRVV